MSSAGACEFGFSMALKALIDQFRPIEVASRQVAFRMSDGVGICRLFRIRDFHPRLA